MVDVSRTPRDPVVPVVPVVRVSVRSAFAVVCALAATVLFLEIARDAERVVAWAFAAMAIAALISPAVAWLAHFRFIPRALAVLITVVLALGGLGFVGYRIVNDVSDAMSSLQQAAPARAAELEKGSDFFQEIELRKRVATLVDEIPNRLAGTGTTEVLKSAASRSLAAVAGLILTIFFILYGGRLLEGGLRLVDDDAARRRVEQIVHRSARRALFYTRVKLWESLVEGFLAYTIARLAGVPGPAALAVWVALWSLLPVAGVMIGALPIVVFAGAHSLGRAIAVAGVFVVIGVCDWWVNRWLERRAVNVGSFVIVLAAFGGLELYGLTGALLFVLGAVLVVAVITEIGPEEVAERLASSSDTAGADEYY